MGKQSCQVIPKVYPGLAKWLIFSCSVLQTKMASCVPPAVVDFEYTQMGQLYECSKCDRQGEADTLEDHIIARHPPQMAPFGCLRCEKMFARELQARAHVTKWHSGHVFADTIKVNGDVDLLGSRARPLSKEEGKHFVHDRLAKRMVRLPKKRKTESAREQPPEKRPKVDTEKALKTSAAASGKGQSSPPSPAKITPKTDAVVPSNESAEAPASPAEPVGDHAVPSRPADIPIDLHAPLGDPLLRTPQTPVLPLPTIPPVVSGEPSELTAMLSTLVASQENCHTTLKELVSEQKGLKTKIDALQTQQGKLQTDLDRDSRIVRAMQGELQKHLAASKKAQEADDARALDFAPLKRCLEEIEERLATGPGYPARTYRAA